MTYCARIHFLGGFGCIDRLCGLVDSAFSLVKNKSSGRVASFLRIKHFFRPVYGGMGRVLYSGGIGGDAHPFVVTITTRTSLGRCSHVTGIIHFPPWFTEGFRVSFSQFTRRIYIQYRNFSCGCSSVTFFLASTPIPLGYAM